MTKKGKKALTRSLGVVTGLLGSAMLLESFMGRGEYESRERWGMGAAGVALVAGATTLEVLSQ